MSNQGWNHEPYIPRYSGKSRVVRLINAVRVRLPRLTHTFEALLRARINERQSDMTWRPLFRIPPPTTKAVVHASSYKEALPKLLAAGGDAFAVVGGLVYRVSPTRKGFISAGDTVTRRKYSSYEEYVSHQTSKLEREGNFIHNTSEKRYRHMRSRFSEISTAAGLSGTVLCLGARLGEEVRAFRDLGMTAIGIDLNPGEKNPYCLYGDFHNLLFPDNAFDVVYSNVLDHVLDLSKFMGEAVRVTRPTGKIYFDLGGGFEETGALDPYGATFWPTNADLVAVLQPYVAEVVCDLRNDLKSTRYIVFHPRKEPLAVSGCGFGET